MGDFGDFASGAGTGALAGSSILPGWGTAIGGVAGGLLGLFTDKSPGLKKMSNPYQGQIDAGINRLMSSHTGAQMAQNAAAGYRRDARAAFDTYQSNPGVSGNASVMSALYNKTQSTAADAITNANVQGVRADEQTHAQGLSAAQGAAAQSQSQQQYNNYVDQMNNRPGPMQQMLMQTLSSAAGSGLAKLAGGGGGGGEAPTDGSGGSGLQTGIQGALGGDIGAGGRSMALPSQPNQMPQGIGVLGSSGDDYMKRLGGYGVGIPFPY